MKTPKDVVMSVLVALCRSVIFAAATWLIKHGLVDADTLSAENVGILALGAAMGLATLAWTYWNKLKVHRLVSAAFYADPADTTLDDVKESVK